MRTIYKYRLANRNYQAIDAPAGFTPLSVQIQDSQFTVWGACESERPYRPLSIYIVGTGQPMPEEHIIYIDTIQAGPYVWHVFYRRND